MRRLDVVGLGEVCIDWTAIVDHLPEPDEKVFSKKYGRFVGGVTANFAVAFARLGGQVGFIGGVGDDEYGKLVLETLKNEGVDVSRLKVMREGRTAINIVVVAANGERVIIQDEKLMSNVPEPRELDDDYIASAKAFHTTAIKLNSAKTGMKIAKEHDLLVSFDLEKHVADYGISKLKPLLWMTDILLPNKLGALSITDETDLLKAAKKLLAMGPKVVVVTLGSDGCMVVTEDATLKIPAFRINAVDTTGAGDAFNAAFIYGLVVKEWDYEKAALYANAVAAIKCTRLGAQSSPRSEEVDEFLKSHGVNL